MTGLCSKRCWGLLWLLLCVLGLNAAQAQFPGQRPRIGLVLSGGGAKGIAHVSLLRTLDSLGIVPDYIAGTSMGAIVGGLYAIGYRGEELEKLALGLDWDLLLSDQVPLREINIEEKDEFGRYIYELPLDGYKPRLPMALVEGQKLDELLARLIFPARHITDFDSLPIPFLCMASDIVHGKAVTLRYGSLASAMRASMAIPSLFTPISTGDELLVDGGLFSNLPVAQCRQMGAELIIGSDVGGGLYPKEELNSIPKILFQSAMLASNADYQLQKQHCNILVDHVRFLKHGAGDFDAAAEILTAGRQAVAASLPELVRLSEQVRHYPTKKIRRLTLQNSDRYLLSEVRQAGISSANERLVLGKFGLSEGDSATLPSLEHAVDRLYGTRLFDKVHFSIEARDTSSNRTFLAIVGKERLPNAFKFGVHYDNEQGAGLTLNFTARNLMGKGTRLLGTLDVAEQPRLRANYMRFWGVRQQWQWWFGGYGERIRQETFRWEDELVRDIVETHGTLEASVRRLLGTSSWWAAGVQAEWSGVSPRVPPEIRSGRAARELRQYAAGTYALTLQYRQNTFDRVFFPLHGHVWQADARYVPYSAMRSSMLLTPEVGDVSVQEAGEVMQPWAQVRVHGQGVRPAGRRRAWLWQLTGAWLFENALGEPRHSAGYMLPVQWLRVGGMTPRPRQHFVQFPGLREGEVMLSQVLHLSGGMQWNLSKRLLLQASGHLLAGAMDPGIFVREWTDWHSTAAFDRRRALHAAGYSLTAAWLSPFGPVSLTWGQSSISDAARINLQLGYRF